MRKLPLEGNTPLVPLVGYLAREHAAECTMFFLSPRLSHSHSLFLSLSLFLLRKVTGRPPAGRKTGRGRNLPRRETRLFDREISLNLSFSAVRIPISLSLSLFLFLRLDPRLPLATCLGSSPTNCPYLSVFLAAGSPFFSLLLPCPRRSNGGSALFRFSRRAND